MTTPDTVRPDQTVRLTMSGLTGQVGATLCLGILGPDRPSMTQQVVIGTESRVSLFLNLLLPETAVATLVESDRPIVAERSMYFAEGDGRTNAVGIPQ